MPVQILNAHRPIYPFIVIGIDLENLSDTYSMMHRSYTMLCHCYDYLQKSFFVVTRLEVMLDVASSKVMFTCFSSKVMLVAADDEFFIRSITPLTPSG